MSPLEIIHGQNDDYGDGEKICKVLKHPRNDVVASSAAMMSLSVDKSPILQHEITDSA